MPAAVATLNQMRSRVSLRPNPYLASATTTLWMNMPAMLKPTNSAYSRRTVDFGRER